MPTAASVTHKLDTANASASADVHTDEGLRRLLDGRQRSDWWNTAPGQQLLAEIRRRAVRNAAHIAARTDTAADRDLVDDVVSAAWLVLRQHQDKVINATRPWAYLMSSAQKHASAEVRAQQLLTSPTSIRGRAREVLPQVVRPVGATTIDLAAALRHEPQGQQDEARDLRITCQVRCHEQPPLLYTGTSTESSNRERELWYESFIDLLIQNGADQNVAVRAVDRAADLLSTTTAGRWEWAARRDPILASLGLCPDQCGALVTLLAGSRHNRHNGRSDSLLRATRTSTQCGVPVELSTLQQRRVATFTGRD